MIVRQTALQPLAQVPVRYQHLQQQREPIADRDLLDRRMMNSLRGQTAELAEKTTVSNGTDRRRFALLCYRVESFFNQMPRARPRLIRLLRPQRLQLITQLDHVPSVRLRPFDARVRQLLQPPHGVHEAPDLLPARCELRPGFARY